MNVDAVKQRIGAEREAAGQSIAKLHQRIQQAQQTIQSEQQQAADAQNRIAYLQGALAVLDSIDRAGAEPAPVPTLAVVTVPESVAQPEAPADPVPG